MCVLHRLGYRPQKAGRGSARVFFNPARKRTTVSFREPHPTDTLRQTAHLPRQRHLEDVLRWGSGSHRHLAQVLPTRLRKSQRNRDQAALPPAILNALEVSR